MEKFDQETSSFAELSEVDSLNDINITNVQIKRKKYILTVGFEVNYPKAFTDGIQDLSIDYGHAFFYVTKNDKVEIFFSFGPKGLAVPGKYTDEYSGERPGNTNYSITEITRLFRLIISEEMAIKVKKNSDMFTAKVNAGTEYFYAFMNDTCAETARDILSKSGISTPPGSGPVKGVDHDRITTRGSFVNPYKWHFDFSEQYGDTGIICYGTGGSDNIDDAFITLHSPWLLYPGDDDVLLSTGNEGMIHDDLTKN